MPTRGTAMNRNDIEQAYNEERLSALTEYRDIMLRRANPKKNDRERLFVVASVLSLSQKDIQADLDVVQEVADLKPVAATEKECRREYEKANEIYEAKDRELPPIIERIRKELSDLYEKRSEVGSRLTAAVNAERRIDKLKEGAKRLWDIPPKEEPKPIEKPMPTKPMVVVKGGAGKDAIDFAIPKDEYDRLTNPLRFDNDFPKTIDPITSADFAKVVK
jgi:hypothetical protein